MKECLNLFSNTKMYVVVTDVCALINNSNNTPNKCKNVKIIYIFHTMCTCWFFILIDMCCTLRIQQKKTVHSLKSEFKRLS